MSDLSAPNQRSNIASLWARPYRAGPHLASVARSLLGVSLVAVTAGIALLLQFNLSAAGSVELLLVVLVALRMGYLQATVVSIGAVIALNYLFTPPVFKFTVADPQNWISLATFETAALLVSRLSSKVRVHATEADLQRLRASKLYELSRAILLIDGRESTTSQLSALIREFIQVDRVELWVNSAHSTEEGVVEPFPSPDANLDDPALRVSRRVLRIGTTSVGAMTLHGWDNDPLLADAVGSLAAIAIERARAIQRENRAEAERDTEQLRTAVLDGLAHSFKTPLTAIQTASSGLLAIDQLTDTQAELVSLIDEQATHLNRLATRLLQTAALETREVRLRRKQVMLIDVLENALRSQDEQTRLRIDVSASPGLIADEVDASMMEIALVQLLDNAARYSTIGSSIQVKITQEAFETTLVVANQGRPIKPEDRQRIFERFYRGAAAGTGPAGTGLGLSIVKKTAEAHGGRVWVETEAGTTRFHLTLSNNRRVDHG